MCLNFCSEVLKFEAFNRGYSWQNDGTNILFAAGIASPRSPSLYIGMGWDRRREGEPIESNPEYIRHL